MKRISAVILSLSAIFIFLSACVNDSPANDVSSFSITSSVYTDSSLEGSKIEISYPQLDGDEYAQINSLISNHAVNEAYRYYGNDFTDLTLSIDSRVTLCDGNILSIIFEGVGNVESVAHPNNLFYTLNIDMKSGERIILTDVYSVDAAFASAYRSSPFVQSNESLADAMSEYIGMYTDDELITLLSSADNDSSGVYSYFTFEKLGVSIPTIHALGDHAETEMNIFALKDNRI